MFNSALDLNEILSFSVENFINPFEEILPHQEKQIAYFYNNGGIPGVGANVFLNTISVTTQYWTS